MAKRYQKDIKVVLPKSNPFRDIAVYGAGEEMIKALGGELPDKGKQPDIVPTKNNPHYMKKSNKKGQSPRSILSPEQRMAMQFGWGGALGSVLGAAAGSFIPVVGTGIGASIGGALGSAVEGSIDNKKQSNQQFQPQYQQPIPQQMQFAKGGMLNKRGIPHRGTSEQMPYQTQMQSYPNLEFGNGEQMLADGGMLKRADGSYSQRGLWDNIRDNKGSGKKPTKEMLAQEAKIKAEYANGGKLPKEILRARAEAHMSSEEANNYVAQYANGGQLEDVEFATGGIHIKPSKKGTFTAAATKHGKSVQGFASQVLANKENYSPAMVKKANFARNAAKWKHADGGFLQEPTEGVIERRNKNRSREPQEYATFEENFKHMYAQGGRMGAMGPMDMSKIYYADGGKKQNDPESINHLQWGKYIDDPKRREQHIVDVYQNLMDSRWDPKDIDQFMKEAGGYGSKSRGDMVKSGSVWGWDHEDITNEVLGKAWDDYYNRSNTPTKLAAGGMLNHYNGYSHENGGIPMGPNAEVEGGETSMKMGMGGEQNSTYIYSDRLKVPGKNYTYADGSKKIDSKYSRRTNDKLSDESKKRELNKLMESQEQERAGLVNSVYETIAAYGGPIRKYAIGGVDPIGKSSYYGGDTDPVLDELLRYEAPTNPDNAMMGLERAQGALDFGAYNNDNEKDLAFQNEMSSQLNEETPGAPYINPSKPKLRERFAENRQNKLTEKFKFNPNAYLDNQGNKADLTAEDMQRDAANIGAVPSRRINNVATPQRSAFSPQQEAEMLKRDMENTKRMGMSAMPTKRIQSVPGGNTIPNTLQNITAPDFNEKVNPNNSLGMGEPGRFGTGEQWAKGIGYGLQGAGLLARQLQLSRKKQTPNKAFTMERQVLNADPQLREADISAAIANRNIRDLGASTSSGGAMAGYLAAQAGRTRSKSDIMADLQNRQAQIDMTTGQYNAMAGERAYDKDAADLAAQQTSQAQLFADMSKLGSGVTRDYLLGQSQEGLMESAYNPYFKYNKQKGRNRYNTQYTG